MYTQRGTRASLKRHLSLLHQLPVAAAQSDRTTHDVVDRWVNARPSQLALNLGQQRVQMVLYRSNHLALSYRASSARPDHLLGVNVAGPCQNPLPLSYPMGRYKVLGGALS